MPVLWLNECPRGGDARPALVVYDGGASPVNLTTVLSLAQEALEAALLGRFREAMTPAMIQALATAIQLNVETPARRRGTRADALKTEILQLERQAGNLVRFLAGGEESPAVRDELRTIEAALRDLRVELAGLEQVAPASVPRVHPAWLKARLEHLHAVVQ